LTRPPAPARGLAVLLVGILGLLLLAGAGITGYLLWERGRVKEAEPPDEEDYSSLLLRGEQPRPRPLITLSPDEEKKARQVTGRGVEFLKGAQDRGGAWQQGSPEHRAGLTAMAGLTLLECDVKADDGAVQRAAAFVRDRCPRLRKTYDLALAILFLTRLGDDRDKERIRQLALRLVAGQTPQGGWSYNCPVLSSPEQEQLLRVLRDLRGGSRAAPPKSQARLPSTPPPVLRGLAVLQDTAGRRDEFFRQGGDNSNTQFALLGLWAARRQGLPLEPALALVARRFQASQNGDGSWNYQDHRNVTGYPSMTAAGLLGLAVGYGLAHDDAAAKGVRLGGVAKGPRGPEDDPAVQKALQVLSQRIGEPRTDPHGPAPPMVELYFLWSVERVAVLYRLETVKGKRWYQWGLDVLAQYQHPDGHWQCGGPGSGPVVDTCFALLFLQRVNLAADLTDKLRALAALSASRDQPAAKQ
jgi:hypothetical protein